jgi:hypothetical protein
VSSNGGRGGGTGNVGGSSGAAGTGGTGSISTGGTGGSGVGGTGGSGVGGTSGTGTGGTGGITEPACWTLEMTGTTQGAASNCVGIFGWNQVEVDPNQTTTMALSYQNGDPCFAGTVGSGGWGAIYDLNFANNSGWDATSVNVTGFNLSFRGATQPASLKLIYKDASAVDFCHMITPGDIAVPFSAAHPSCSNSATSPTANLTQLHDLLLAFLPVSGQSYNVDFCVELRALD